MSWPAFLGVLVIFFLMVAKTQLSLAKVALITNAADELITAFPGRP
jgi:hypothetical protein